jgi:hypothetical protein
MDTRRELSVTPAAFRTRAISVSSSLMQPPGRMDEGLREQREGARDHSGE